jgi:predicted Zn-dependent protease
MNQRHSADALRPKTTDPPPLADPPRYHVRIRVLADADYRAHAMDWRAQAEHQIYRASDALAAYGADFVIVQMREWDRRSAATLDEDLLALEKTERGTDVDLVLGLVSASTISTPLMHQIGLARVLGKHCVLRGMDDAIEREAITSSYSMISRDELDKIYTERKRHKESAMLIHEWGHTLGAFHVLAVDDYMHPSYSEDQRGFSTENAALIRLGLEHGDRNTNAGQRRWLQAVVEEVDRQALHRQVSSDQQELMNAVRAALAATPEMKPAAPVAASLPADAPPRLTEDEVNGCTLRGMQWASLAGKANATQRRQKAEQELSDAAKKMKGNTVQIQAQGEGAKATLLGKIYFCQ